MAPIQRGLEDRHPYVRRTAVMGVLKVHNFDAAAVQNAGELERCSERFQERSSKEHRGCARQDIMHQRGNANEQSLLSVFHASAFSTKSK